MIACAKTFGSPEGEPSTIRLYTSTNVRKTLDTTPTRLTSLELCARCLTFTSCRGWEERKD